MWYIESYEKFHQKRADSASIGGGITLPGESTMYALVSLGHVLNFIESGLK